MSLIHLTAEPAGEGRAPDAVAVAPMVVARPGRRAFPFLDVLRGLTAMVVMAHHLVLYGPVSDVAYPLAPGLFDWLWADARPAVQVFFVISGFVTALSLGDGPIGARGFARFAARRYVRLAVPYLATIAILLVLAVLIPPGRAAFPIREDPSPGLLLAHALFAQNLLGYPNLSAGFWYLCIDVQFGLACALLLMLERWLAGVLGVPGTGSSRTALRLAVFLPLACGSLFLWNEDPAHEAGVHYFFGALMLGLVAGWVQVGRLPTAAFWGYAGLVGLALAVQWRDRLALALLVGVLVHLLARLPARPARPALSPLLWVGGLSYSLFLIHYPVHALVSTLTLACLPQTPGVAALALVGTFGLSLAAAWAFWRLVEHPSVRLADRFR